MYIVFENAATRRFCDADLMDEPVSVAETGTAQVPQEVGEALVAHYDRISVKED
ncbi:hypothetical protein [Halobacterium hubeiense]|uniref:hypothetical protein n=1 Tax=Halobacterium hubeiense TaxID=1407499 RepID=UPI0015C606CF|nr:hypothetical protein [Halobacterium hubeiense]